MLLRSAVRYRKAMYAQCKGRLAVVMVVVADEIPDHLLASIGVEVIAASSADRMTKVSDSPGIQRLLDRLPGRL